MSTPTGAADRVDQRLLPRHRQQWPTGHARPARRPARRPNSSHRSRRPEQRNQRANRSAGHLLAPSGSSALTISGRSPIAATPRRSSADVCSRMSTTGRSPARWRPVAPCDQQRAGRRPTRPRVKTAAHSRWRTRRSAPLIARAPGSPAPHPPPGHTTVDQNPRPLEERSQRAGRPRPREPPTRKGHNPVQRRVMLNRRGEGVLHKPVDPRIRVRRAERRQYRHAPADVAQGAGSDDEDASGGLHASRGDRT